MALFIDLLGCKIPVFRMQLPYITKEIEGIGGRIKKKPEHFIVEEIPLYNPSGSLENNSEHLYINITKQGINSKYVEKKLAEIFDVKVRDVGMAGLKDKNVISKQTLSVFIKSREKRTHEFVKEKIREVSSLEGIEVNWYKWHDNKLRKGHLLGNRFKIVISDLPESENKESDEKKSIEKAKKVLSKIEKTGVPNYFGEQRFGIRRQETSQLKENDEKTKEGGSNINKSIKVVKGEKQLSGWIKNFMISVYQSYLCNRYLARRVKEGNFDKIMTGDIAKKHDTGGLFEVTEENLERENERFEKGEISFTAPIYGKKLWWPSDNTEAREFEERIFNEESYCSLKDINSQGTRRLGRIFPEDIEVKEHPEGIELDFSLFKGGFATVILREIMKNF